MKLGTWTGVKCSRCGAEAEFPGGRAYAIEEAEKGGWRDDEQKLLCPHCVAEHKRFMAGEATGIVIKEKEDCP